MPKYITKISFLVLVVVVIVVVIVVIMIVGVLAVVGFRFIVWVILEGNIIHFVDCVILHLMNFPGNRFENFTVFEEVGQFGNIILVGCVLGLVKETK